MSAAVPNGEYVHFHNQGTGNSIQGPSDFTGPASEKNGNQSDYVIHQDGLSFIVAYMRAVGQRETQIRIMTRKSAWVRKDRARGGRQLGGGGGWQQVGGAVLRGHLKASMLLPKCVWASVGFVWRWCIRCVQKASGLAPLFSDRVDWWGMKGGLEAGDRSW